MFVSLNPESSDVNSSRKYVTGVGSNDAVTSPRTLRGVPRSSVFSNEEVFLYWNPIVYDKNTLKDMIPKRKVASHQISVLATALPR